MERMLANSAALDLPRDLLDGFDDSAPGRYTPSQLMDFPYPMPTSRCEQAGLQVGAEYHAGSSTGALTFDIAPFDASGWPCRPGTDRAPAAANGSAPCVVPGSLPVKAHAVNNHQSGSWYSTLERPYGSASCGAAPGTSASNRSTYGTMPARSNGGVPAPAPLQTVVGFNVPSSTQTPPVQPQQTVVGFHLPPAGGAGVIATHSSDGSQNSAVGGSPGAPPA